MTNSISVLDQEVTVRSHVLVLVLCAGDFTYCSGNAKYSLPLPRCVTGGDIRLLMDFY